MSNILITGAGGFIGSNLAMELQKCSTHNITALDNFKYFGNMKNLEGFNSEILKLDIRDIGLLQNKYDFIFHQAAISDTRHSNEEEILDVNYNSFNSIIEFAKLNNSKLIYASSAAQYGNCPAPQTVGIENPENTYAKTKFLMDEITKNSDYKNIIGLRYFNVYGPGEEYKGSTSSLIYQWIKKAINDEEIILFDDSDSTFRDFIFIDDIIRANIEAMDVPFGIYNIGTGISHSFQEVFEMIQYKFNKRLKLKYIKNPYNSYQKNTQANMVGSFFKANILLSDGIEKYIEDMKGRYESSCNR